MKKFPAKYPAFFGLCIVLGFGFLIWGGIRTTAGDSTYSQITAADSSTAEESFDDGPHVFLSGDSAAIVFYVCNDTLIKQTVRCRDTLRFHGYCADSAEEYLIPLAMPPVEPEVFDNVPKIFAVSDVHGEYDHLVAILKNAGVIDDGSHWMWGDGHLVVLGDIFDRGAKVTECLWLVYRLEQEAMQSGGRVHFLLGNHELMVLRGDNRYIDKRYLNGIVKKTRIEHKDLYGPDMVLGRWLRSKNTVIKINTTIFIHGGIPPFFTERDLTFADVNQTVRKNLDLRSSQYAFNDVAKLFYGSGGPFWYRGYFEEKDGYYPLASEGQIDSTLSFYHGEAIVVGHTEVEQVSGRYNNRVITIDVPVEDLGGLQGLLWVKGTFYRVDVDGEIEALE